MARLYTRSKDDKVTLPKGDKETTLNASTAGVLETLSTTNNDSKNGTEESNITTIPVVKEFLQINKKIIEKSKVKIIKTVDKEQKEINIPLEYDEVEIKTVPVNEYIDVVPEAIRFEGDTMIISVIKEVTVVRILLEKEIHVIKTKKTKQHVEAITLRSEKIDFQRNEIST